MEPEKLFIQKLTMKNLKEEHFPQKSTLPTLMTFEVIYMFPKLNGRQFGPFLDCSFPIEYADLRLNHFGSSCA